MPQIYSLLEGYKKPVQKKVENEFSKAHKEEFLEKFFLKCSELIVYRINTATETRKKINAKKSRAVHDKDTYEQEIKKKYQLLQHHLDEMKQNFVEAWRADKQIVLAVDSTIYELGLSCELRKKLDEIYSEKFSKESLAVKISMLKKALIIYQIFASDDVEALYEKSLVFMEESAALNDLIQNYFRSRIKQELNQELNNVLREESIKLSKKALSASDLRKKLDAFFSEKSPVDRVVKEKLLEFDKSLASDALKKWDELKRTHEAFLAHIEKCGLSLKVLIKEYASWVNQQEKQEEGNKEWQIYKHVDVAIQQYASEKKTPLYNGFFRRKRLEPPSQLKPASVGDVILDMFLSCVG